MLVKFLASYRHWIEGEVYDLPDGVANVVMGFDIAKEHKEKPSGRSNKKRGTNRVSGNTRRAKKPPKADK